MPDTVARGGFPFPRRDLHSDDVLTPDPSTNHLPCPPRPDRELWLTGLLFAVTAGACALFGRDMVRLGIRDWSADRVGQLTHLALFVGFVLFLVYGNLVYQIARFGYFARLRRPPVPGHDALPLPDAQAAAPLVILVPAYKEAVRTMRQTLLSAALQAYPNRRVVLLLDDPPGTRDPDDAARLAAARQLPADIAAWLEEPAARVRRAAEARASRCVQGHADPRSELVRLLDVYAEVDAWFAAQIAACPRADHTDELFVTLVLGGARRLHRARARRLTRQLAGEGLSRDQLQRAYDDLAAHFRVEVSAFERKRYVNLSHAPNKAANLNSYLGLLGKRVRAVRRPGDPGVHLDIREPGAGGAGAIVPDAVYVLTLDTDSLLAPEYAQRLVATMEKRGNERLAVVQTPYTAIPKAPGLLERIAGATTDLQYVVHQGFTWCGATFWVGANALLRKAALDDLKTVEIERGHRLPKFIQDRTVIEDTESTIDLVARGWWLHNHPARLAFSATPPDFGALLIQRRRWANGGLLIVPKCLRYALRRPFRFRRLLEVPVRLHYLISPCVTSLGLLGLIVLPLARGMHDLWLPLTAAPYFLLYGRDLTQQGYRASDLWRVYALNLLLIPVNLAGAAKSVQQGLTGAKIPFGRTPKVERRTAVPAWAVLIEYLILARCLSAGIWDAFAGRWGVALFSLGTAAALGYALIAFVGLRAAVSDVLAPLARRRDRALRLLMPRMPVDAGSD